MVRRESQLADSPPRPTGKACAKRSAEICLRGTIVDLASNATSLCGAKGFLLVLMLFAAVGFQPALLLANDGSSLNCSLECGLTYTTNRWTPVIVRLTNRTDASGDGYLVFEAGRDCDVVVHQDVRVPPHSNVIVHTAVLAGIEGNSNLQPGDITRAIWYATDGREIARTTLAGHRLRNITGGSDGKSPSPLHETLILSLDSFGASDGSSPANESFLADLIQASTGWSTAEANIQDSSQLPRSLTEYQAFGCVLLAAPPDDLDAAQRQALLDHVRAGAVLIVPGAFEAAHLEQSWLEPYLPVRIAGFRQLSQIFPKDGGDPIKLVETVPVSEAFAVDHAAFDESIRVILEDRNYVHAAFRRVGLGRVVFTSFPAAALAPNDSRTPSIWRRLLDVEQSLLVQGDVTMSPQLRQEAMSQLLGRPAPPGASPRGLSPDMCCSRSPSKCLSQR